VTKVQIVSDLHCEFHHDDGAAMIADIPVAGDVLVIAGDLMLAKWTHKRLRAVLNRFSDRWPAVIYVSGNHESYYLDIGLAAYNLRSAAKESGVVFLNNEAREVAGLKFFGGAGWFPNRSRGPVSWGARRGMADFRLVKGIEFDAPFSNAMFRLALQAEGPVDVVVSHHLPAAACVVPQYAGSPLNAYFVADFEDLLPFAGLWVHGHTHFQVDTIVDDTRILCNPRGYPHENPLPYPALVVDVEPRQPKEDPMSDKTQEERKTEARQYAAREAAFVGARIDLAMLNAATLAVNFGASEQDFVEGARSAYAEMSLKLPARAAQILADADELGI
jgi:hypothetical protein